MAILDPRIGERAAQPPCRVFDYSTVGLVEDVKRACVDKFVTLEENYEDCSCGSGRERYGVGYAWIVCTGT
jgi:hypothetical protein